MAKYLVTGGAGFIGSHLVNELIESGHEVCVIDNLSTGKRSNLNEKAEFFYGDINNERLAKQVMSQCQACFHLAAVASVEASITDWVNTSRTNLSGTIQLLDIAKDLHTDTHPLPFIFASSAAVYGANPDCPYKESDKTSPISPYGIDKLSSEMQIQFASQFHGIPSAILRFFNVYGERQDPNSPYSGVISIFSKRLQQNKPLHVFGDGQQTRDFIYVKDIVSMLICALEIASNKSPVYNACTGNEVTLNQLVETLSDVMHTQPQVNYEAPRIGDIKISKGDNSLAKMDLNVSANTSLYDGLSSMLRYKS